MERGVKTHRLCEVRLVEGTVKDDGRLVFFNGLAQLKKTQLAIGTATYVLEQKLD